MEEYNKLTEKMIDEQTSYEQKVETLVNALRKEHEEKIKMLDNKRIVIGNETLDQTVGSIKETFEKTNVKTHQVSGYKSKIEKLNGEIIAERKKRKELQHHLEQNGHYYCKECGLVKTDVGCSKSDCKYSRHTGLCQYHDLCYYHCPCDQ